MSIYIHIDQRSHNNMLLILCGTLHENTKKNLHIIFAPIYVKPQREVGICGVFDNQLHPHPGDFN